MATIYPKTFDTYNMLELLAEEVLSYFEKEGKPKKVVISTFYDYIFISNVLGDWSVKIDYDEIDFAEKEELSELDDDEDESEDNYIKA